jgi:DNA-binding NtrC family response regulator
MRAVLFVDEVHLQRTLARELGRLGFDVILPITLNEARQALQLEYRPDLVVMSLRNAEGGTPDLLKVIAEARIVTSVVLLAEAAEIAGARRRIAQDRIEVLPAEEVRSFSRSVRRLCSLEMPAL